MQVHAIIVDTGGDLKKSFDSVKDCSATSIISYKLAHVVDNLEYFLGPNNGYHYLAEHASVDEEINKLIKEVESEFYVVITAGEELSNITQALTEYTKEKKLALVKPYCKYSKLVVHSKTHLFLFGNGSQNIEEKIEISSINNKEEYMVLESIEELYEQNKSSMSC